MLLNWVILFFIAVSRIFISGQSLGRLINKNKQNQVCPPSCNPTACEIGILTCNNPGLDKLPRYLHEGTKKLLFYNQNFHERNVISADNFTFYQPPIQKINKITIQNCSIKILQPKAFSDLIFLETLDLSMNQIKEIHPYTFANLKLNLLRLDGNKGIKLSQKSFAELQVKSLHLEKCLLTNLPFDIISPVSYSLEKLTLANNHLIILDSRFEGLFKRLKSISLFNNPFDCGQCQLKWLVIQMKSLANRDSQAEESIYPRCAQPAKLGNVLLHRLSLISDFQCPIASVRSISVIILPNNSATLTCTAGHESSLVTWRQFSHVLSKSIFKNKFTVNQMKKIDSFSCTVSIHGNQNSSTTRLQIAWPRLVNRNNFTLNLLNPSNKGSINSYENTRNPNLPNTNSADSYFFQPQFSLIEMIAGVVGTFVGTLIMFIAMLKCLFCRVRFFTSSATSKHSQFHDLHNHDMHHHHHHQHHQQQHQNHNHYLHNYNSTTQNHNTNTNTNNNTNNNNNNSNKTPQQQHYFDSTMKSRNLIDDSSHTQMLPKRYVAYEPPTYSDSQTYDVPTLTTSSPLPPPPSVSTTPSVPLIPNSLGHFIDFKTQKTVYGAE